MLTYQFEKHGNPCYATLHVSVKLHMGRYGSSITPEVLTPELKQLARMLATIDGVDCVDSIDNHAIRFSLSPLFSVDEVLATAMVVFTAWHGTAVSQWVLQK